MERRWCAAGIPEMLTAVVRCLLEAAQQWRTNTKEKAAYSSGKILVELISNYLISNKMRTPCSSGFFLYESMKKT